MCDPVSLTLAGTQMYSQLGAASATNEASRKNAEGLIAQSKAAAGQQLIEQMTNLQNLAKERFGRTRKEAEILGTVRANFADIIGTPQSDAEQMVKNDAQDAQDAIAKSMAMTQLDTKNAMREIAMGTASRIGQLPTVSVTEQAMQVGETALGAVLMSKQIKALDKMAAGTDVISKVGLAASSVSSVGETMATRSVSGNPSRNLGGHDARPGHGATKQTRVTQGIK